MLSQFFTINLINAIVGNSGVISTATNTVPIVFKIGIIEPIHLPISENTFPNQLPAVFTASITQLNATPNASITDLPISVLVKNR